MANKKPTTLVTQISETQQALELLGPQAVYIPCRTNDLHVQTTTGQMLKHDSVIGHIQTGGSYTNIKVKENSAPKGFLWLTVDYDDHDKKDKIAIDVIRKKFKLPPTYTIKTPTGAGIQEVYLLPEASGIFKTKFEIDGIEVFVGVRNSDSLRAVPGSSKKNGMYTFINAIPPAQISNMLLTALKTQQQYFIDKNIAPSLELHKHYAGDIDGLANRKAAAVYLDGIANKALIEGTPIESGNRDKYLFAVCCQLATHYLSLDTMQTFIEMKIFNQVVFPDMSDLEDDFVERKCIAALRFVTEADRRTERATELDVFDHDDHGHYTISRQKYIDKAEHVFRYAPKAIMEDEKLRKLFYELIVYDQETNTYFVPRMYSKESYNIEYKESLTIEAQEDVFVDYTDLLESKVKTALHWVQLDTPVFNRAFYVFVNGRKISASNTQLFDTHHLRAKVNDRKKPASGNIMEHGIFYATPEPAIKPILDPSKEDIKEVKILMREMISRLIDVNYIDVELPWFLDRIAKMYQSPCARTSNCMILLGPQGSGKSAIMSLFMSLFPSNMTNTIFSVDELEGRFIDWAPFTHFDDIDFNTVSPKMIAMLKALVSTEKVTIEKKFKDRVAGLGALNLSIGTNTTIKDPEFLKGRRYTILVNETAYDVDAIQPIVKAEMTAFKANDWHLLSVLAGILLKRDTSKFKANFKTQAQYDLMFEAEAGAKITQFLVNLIANYGYIAPNRPVFIPGELVNRFDIITLAHHYEDPREIHEYRKPERGTRVDGLSDFQEPSFRKVAKIEWGKTFVDPEGVRIQSRINDSIGPTNTNKVPTIQEWIILLAYYETRSRNKDSITKVINRYKLHDQWEWDNKTKPDIADLGTINQYDNLDIDVFIEEF